MLWEWVITLGAASAPVSAAGVLPGCRALWQGDWRTGSPGTGARRRCEIPRSARPGKGVQPGALVERGVGGAMGSDPCSPSPKPRWPPGLRLGMNARRLEPALPGAGVAKAGRGHLCPLLQPSR